MWELFVPKPANVVRAFARALTSGYRSQTLLAHLGHSLIRVLTGYCLALNTAVPRGRAMGYSERIQEIFDPIIEDPDWLKRILRHLIKIDVGRPAVPTGN